MVTYDNNIDNGQHVEYNGRYYVFHVKRTAMKRIRDGFKGQKMLVLPQKVVDSTAKSPLSNTLYLADIGYFPNAAHHHVKREFELNQYILIYCVEGIGWYKMEQTQTVGPNQFFILKAGLPHSYGAGNQKPWTIYWFHFSGIDAWKIWELYVGAHYPVGNVLFSEHRISLFEQLYTTLEMGYSQDHIGFTNMALWHLLGSFIYPVSFEPRHEMKRSGRIDNVIRYMRKNLTQHLSLKELARYTNYSIPHFTAEFKKKTGYSPIDYHNRLRIQKACQYLDLTDSRIKEVGYRLGYQDPYYFSRLFSKIMGKSPSQYKAQVKG